MNQDYFFKIGIIQEWWCVVLAWLCHRKYKHRLNICLVLWYKVFFKSSFYLKIIKIIFLGIFLYHYIKIIMKHYLIFFTLNIFLKTFKNKIITILLNTFKNQVKFFQFLFIWNQTSLNKSTFSKLSHNHYPSFSKSKKIKGKEI